MHTYALCTLLLQRMLRLGGLPGCSTGCVSIIQIMPKHGRQKSHLDSNGCQVKAV